MKTIARLVHSSGGGSADKLHHGHRVYFLNFWLPFPLAISALRWTLCFRNIAYSATAGAKRHCASWSAGGAQRTATCGSFLPGEACFGSRVSKYFLIWIYYKFGLPGQKHDIYHTFTLGPGYCRMQRADLKWAVHRW